MPSTFFMGLNTCIIFAMYRALGLFLPNEMCEQVAGKRFGRLLGVLHAKIIDMPFTLPLHFHASFDMPE